MDDFSDDISRKKSIERGINQPQDSDIDMELIDSRKDKRSIRQQLANLSPKSDKEKILDAVSKITDIEVPEDLFIALTTDSDEKVDESQRDRLDLLINEMVEQVTINEAQVGYPVGLEKKDASLNSIDFYQALIEKRQKEYRKLIEEIENCLKERNTFVKMKEPLSQKDQEQYEALTRRDQKFNIKRRIIDGCLEKYKSELAKLHKAPQKLLNGHQYSARYYDSFNSELYGFRLPVGEDWLFEKVTLKSLKEAEKKLDEFYNKHHRDLSKSENSKFQKQFEQLRSEFLKKRLCFDFRSKVDFTSQIDFEGKLKVIEKVASTYNHGSLEELNHKIKLLEKFAEEITKQDALNAKKIEAMDKEIKAMQIELARSEVVLATSREKLIKTDPLYTSRIKKQEAIISKNENIKDGISEKLNKNEEALGTLKLAKEKQLMDLSRCHNQIAAAKKEYLNRAKEKAKIDGKISGNIFEKMLDGLDFRKSLNLKEMMGNQSVILHKRRDDAVAELRKYDDEALMGESTLWQRLGGSKAKKAFESFKKAQKELDAFNKGSSQILSVEAIVNTPIVGEEIEALNLKNIKDGFNKLLKTNQITTQEIFSPKDIEKSVKEARKNYVRALYDQSTYRLYSAADAPDVAVQKAILDLREAQYAVYGKGQMTSYKYETVAKLKKRLAEINEYIPKEKVIDRDYEQAVEATKKILGTSGDKRVFQRIRDEQIQRLKTSFSDENSTANLSEESQAALKKNLSSFIAVMQNKDPYLEAKELLTELTKIETNSAQFFFMTLAQNQLSQESAPLSPSTRFNDAETQDLIKAINLVKSNRSYQERYLNRWREFQFTEEYKKLGQKLLALEPGNKLDSLSDFSDFFINIQGQGEDNPFYQSPFIEAASAFDKLFFQKPDLIVDQDKAWQEFMNTPGANKLLNLFAYLELVKTGKISNSEITFTGNHKSLIDNFLGNLQRKPEYKKLSKNFLKTLKDKEKSSSDELKVEPSSNRQWALSWWNKSKASIPMSAPTEEKTDRKKTKNNK